jgi:hypothetical protein
LLLAAPSPELRRFALWAFKDSWLYLLTGRKRGGDVYQSRGRLVRIYRRNGLVIERDAASPTFLGFPVFIYHRLRKIAI